MSRAALIVIAALLVAGAAAGSLLALPAAAQAADSPIVMLTIDSPSQTDHATQDMDVSRALGLQREAAVSEIERHAFEERIEDADDDVEERAVVREEIVRVDERFDELRRAESALREDYVQGRIDSKTYLYELAKLDARATLLGERLDTLRPRADERDLETNDVAALEARLVGYYGPVRDRLGAAILGEAPAIRVDLKASPNGTTLAMIEDGTHVREAYRADERTATVGTIPTDELYGSFTNELVSEVYEIEPQSTSIRGVGLGAYEIAIRGPRAAPYVTVTAYIDGDTREIFSEIQERELDRLPPREAVEATANGTRLVVNRSFPGGPLEIATYDNATGQPTSTAVEIDGERFRTDDEGKLWTLTPRRYAFPVTATGPSGNVSVEVRTTQPLPVDSDS